MIFRKKTPQHHIFLSHSGLDAKLAKKLARTLEQKLGRLGYPTKVFNTSEPEYRFYNLEEDPRFDENFADRIYEYELELRKYLQKNLKSSVGYVLLVTRKSMDANSEWIKFEMDFARAKSHSDPDFFFIPCTASGAYLYELPETAMIFQGVNLEEQGEDFLARIIVDFLKQHNL